jgi:hypothetical protein
MENEPPTRHMPVSDIMLPTRPYCRTLNALLKDMNSYRDNATPSFPLARKLSDEPNDRNSVTDAALPILECW